MELVADVLLIAGALGAAFYCVVLSRRLSRFNDLETGVGGAIAVLSAQVDDMTRALKSAQGTAEGSATALEGLTNRADGVAQRLELLVASMHDLPEVSGERPPEPPAGEDGFAPMRFGTSRAPKPAPKDAAWEADAPDPDAAGAPPALFRSQRSWSREAAE